MGIFRKKEAIAKLFEQVASDDKKGALELTVLAIKAFRHARPTAYVKPDKYMEAVFSLARQASRLRPSMAPIGGALSELAHNFSSEVGAVPTSEELYRKLLEAVDKLLSGMEGLQEKIAGNFSCSFPNILHPIVLSYSSTVVSVLQLAGQKRFDVVVCESRPAMEGRKTAKLLLGSVKSVSLITEAQIALALKSCDAVLLGCDSIFPDGSIINKTGSHMLALCARDSEKPVIVLGDSYKLAGEHADYAEKHPQSEVWRHAPEEIKLRNEYFEKVPAVLIDHLVLESGHYKPHQVNNLWQSVLGQRMF